MKPAKFLTLKGLAKMYKNLIYNQRLLSKYIRQGIIVDTEPLLLFLVGNYDSTYIERFSRTKDYTIGDFEITDSFLKKFKKIVVTPHILAELSNLAKEMPDEHFRKFIESCILHLKKFNEIYINKNEILTQEEAKKIGITDVSIILASEKEDCLIFTKDRELSQISRDKKGLGTIHFNELRSFNWFRA